MYYASAQELNKLDSLAVKHGLEIRQMMELAGWHILSVFKDLKISKKAKVVLVCGKGNKGGDGLCAARHLINHGWNVSIILLSRQVSTNANHQLKLLKKMKAPIFSFKKDLIAKADILIDALIGYNLQGAPRGIFAQAIKSMNESKAKVIAYDLPSGMDASTGECFEPCIEAKTTLTLAAYKKAFKYKKARSKCGQIYLGDIGIPKFLYDKINY